MNFWTVYFGIVAAVVTIKVLSFVTGFIIQTIAMRKMLAMARSGSQMPPEVKG